MAYAYGVWRHLEDASCISVTDVDDYTRRPRELAAVSSRRVAVSPRVEDRLHSPCHVTSYPRLRQAGVEPVTEPPKLCANSGDPAFYKW